MTRSRRRAAVAVLLLAAAAVPFPAPAAPPFPSDRYVAMGSSFAAGPGIGAPDPTSGRCARSSSNYAHLVAARSQLSLADVSCSGATTADILHRRQFGVVPPQIDAVDARTRLVTVLIGGNDLSYMANLFGYSCQDTGGTACRILPPDAVAARLTALPASLAAVLSAIRARAPAARILLVSYQPVLPPAGTPSCAAIPLAPADADRLRAVDAALNHAFRAAAAASRVTLIPADTLLAGHDACSATPFIAGYTPPRTPGWPHPVPYHPNQAAMDRLAAAIGAVLARPPGPPFRDPG